MGRTKARYGGGGGADDLRRRRVCPGAFLRATNSKATQDVAEG